MSCADKDGLEDEQVAKGGSCALPVLVRHLDAPLLALPLSILPEIALPALPLPGGLSLSLSLFLAPHHFIYLLSLLHGSILVAEM